MTQINDRMRKRKAKKVFFGSVPVGGETPITVQSMTNTETSNVSATVSQIKKLEDAGCEIIRVAVPDEESAACLAEIKAKIGIPLIADIHFDYRLALKSIVQGVDGLRINPGNIGNKERVKKVVNAALKAEIPIRVGVNAGSLSREILQKFGQPSAEAMVESALQNIKILEEEGFTEIVVSLKATDIWRTVKAHELIAKEIDYPFHIGITEAGGGWKGKVKSATGLGALLTRGYGDTLRVSLTGDPIEEVEVGWQVLRELGLRSRGPRIISCPTCSRTGVDLVKLTAEVEELVSDIKEPLTVAVMGCAVNGPGEAREADIGIAAGKGEGLIFKNGQQVKKVKEDKLIACFAEEIKKLIENKED